MRWLVFLADVVRHVSSFFSSTIAYEVLYSSFVLSYMMNDVCETNVLRREGILYYKVPVEPFVSIFSSSTAT